jgi:hypothetical protein
MKKMKFSLSVISLCILFSLAGCTKDDKSSDTGVAYTDVSASQDSESQDAIAENIDQSVDNSIDALEANDFTGLKSSIIKGVSYTVANKSGIGEPKDTSIFPKIITFTFGDTTINSEHISYSGTVYIIDSLSQAQKPWRNYLIRKVKFGNFTITTDSSSVSINGSRTVSRQSVKTSPTLTPNNILTVTNVRYAVKDSVRANLSFIITKGNYTGTFTRVVKKTREAYAHFEKVTGTRIWIQNHLKDTLTYNGSITGVNLKSENYSRTITTPIVYKLCSSYIPVISQGVLALTNGTNALTVTYSADNCKTIVTIAKGNKTKVIERKLNRSFH